MIRRSPATIRNISQFVISSGLALHRVGEIAGAAVVPSGVRVGATERGVPRLTGQVAEGIRRFCLMPHKIGQERPTRVRRTGNRYIYEPNEPRRLFDRGTNRETHF